jgi:hypothetical protein
MTVRLLDIIGITGLLAVFDDGYLSRDPVMAKAMMDSLLLIMRGDSQGPKIPLIEIHDTIWRRLLKVCFLGFLRLN